MLTQVRAYDPHHQEPNPDWGWMQMNVWRCHSIVIVEELQPRPPA